MKRNRFDGFSKLAIGAILTTSILSFGTNVSAQSAPNSQNEQSVETVIVTATKRSEKLQDVPISITAFSAAKLEQLNPDNLSDLANQVPNLYMPPPNESASQTITMRGLGAGVTRSGGRAVGVYIDGVYTSADNLMNVPINDIASLEVLKGPQATLFGRDTIGGAINITTRKPSNVFNGYFEGEVGNYGRTLLNAGFDVPISPDKAVFRFSLRKFDYGGHIQNRFNGQKADGKDQLSATAQLYMTPRENLEMRLVYNHSYRRDNPTTGENAGGTFADQIPYSVNMNVKETFDQDSDSLSFSLNYDFANGYKLTSISGWAKSSDKSLADRDLTPDNISTQSILYDVEDLSQEIRLTSPAIGKFDYLVGAHFLRSHIVNRDTYPLFGAAWLANVGFPPLLPDVLDGQERDFTTKSAAIFVHSNYRFTDKFSVFGGLRYSDVKKDIDHKVFGEIFNAFGYKSANRQGKTEDAAYSWTVGAKYALSDSVKTYVTIANGFRSSSIKDDFITSNDLAVPQGFATDPEFVTNYEAGVKIRSHDGRLNANFALFYMDYKDIQVSLAVPPLLFVRQLFNAGKAHIAGFEYDASFALTKNLQISGSLGFLETEYDEFNESPALVGRGFGNAPEWSAAIALDYKRPIGTYGKMMFHIDNSLITVPGDFAPNRSQLELGGFGTMNGSIGVETNDKKWLYSLWGKNLFDKHDTTGTTIWGAGLGLNQHSVYVYQDPKTYGLSAKYRF